MSSTHFYYDPLYYKYLSKAVAYHVINCRYLESIQVGQIIILGNEINQL